MQSEKRSSWKYYQVDIVKYLLVSLKPAVFLKIFWVIVCLLIGKRRESLGYHRWKDLCFEIFLLLSLERIRSLSGCISLKVLLVCF